MPLPRLSSRDSVGWRVSGSPAVDRLHRPWIAPSSSSLILHMFPGLSVRVQTLVWSVPHSMTAIHIPPGFGSPLSWSPDLFHWGCRRDGSDQVGCRLLCCRQHRVGQSLTWCSIPRKVSIARYLSGSCSSCSAVGVSTSRSLSAVSAVRAITLPFPRVVVSL